MAKKCTVVRECQFLEIEHHHLVITYDFGTWQCSTSSRPFWWQQSAVARR